MTKNKIEREYVNWMYSIVCQGDDSHKRTYYRRLLEYLHERNFIFKIDLDGNRAEDGIDLRYRFSYDKGYSYPMVASYLDNSSCSVLEMMVALSIRCEEWMDNPAIGTRTNVWFWNMIESLGLDYMIDSKFDSFVVDDVLEIFHNRMYQKNGKGGLFTIRRNDRDMRTVEIWCQMCWYLNEVLEGEYDAERSVRMV